MNWFRTFALMAFLTAMVVAVGQLVGGGQGAQLAFLVALGMNFLGYWFSDKLVLMAYRARPVSESEAPRLHGMVRSLAQRAGLPMPRVAVIPSRAPNAFATGRGPSSAVVAVTEGLLEILDSDELEGVLAHELAHVKNRDILVGTIAASLAGAISMVTRWALFFGGGAGRDDDEGGINPIFGILLIVLAPIAAMLVQLAVTRSREFGADATGAAISRKPRALASALMKLERVAEARPLDVNPATSHLFIVNPLGGDALRGVANLFRTHPSTEQRVARLQEIARGMGMAA
jgi:heat shock protein HtpX